jgi:hypothetical protein
MYTKHRILETKEACVIFMLINHFLLTPSPLGTHVGPLIKTPHILEFHGQSDDFTHIIGYITHTHTHTRQFENTKIVVLIFYNIYKLLERRRK